MRLVACFEQPMPCVVTEFMDGGNLTEYLQKKGPQSTEEATRLALGIAKGLQYLHDNHIIHRDIKSPNILVRVQSKILYILTLLEKWKVIRWTLFLFSYCQLNSVGQPFLADFGWAKFSTHTNTIASDLTGTWQWLAPEMIQAEKKHNNKVDIYSFGIVLWELLSGEVFIYLAHTLHTTYYTRESRERERERERESRKNIEKKLILLFLFIFFVLYLKLPYYKQGLRDIQIPMFVMSGKRLPIDPKWDSKLAQLMERCWHQNATVRPSAAEIVSLLSDTSGPKLQAQLQSAESSKKEIGTRRDPEGAKQDGRSIDVDSCRKSAEKGHAEYQCHLAWMYSNGHGVRQDERKAVEWYRKAAKQGYRMAQFNLGTMYDNGRGVKKDESKALNWFRKAAEKGDMDAQYIVGKRYSEGRGVKKDVSKAVEWYRQAAEQGNAMAQTKLKAIYHRSKKIKT